MIHCHQQNLFDAPLSGAAGCAGWRHGYGEQSLIDHGHCSNDMTGSQAASTWMSRATPVPASEVGLRGDSCIQARGSCRRELPDVDPIDVHNTTWISR